jgi:hypothetical protein
MPKTNSPVFKVKAPSFPRQSAAMQRIEVGEVSLPFFLNGTLVGHFATKHHHITQHKNYIKQSNPFLPKSLKNNQVSHCCPNTAW